MVQILPEAPDFGTQFARNLGAGLSRGVEKGTDFAQQIALTNSKKKQENVALKDRGRESIQAMRDILSRGKTGWNVFNYATEEGRADRAAMDTAALNLERLAVEMQGRGVLSKPRFEYMIKRLPSSSNSDAANNAILDEWESILSEEKGQKKSSSKNKKMKFDLSNPEHKAKRDQLLKHFKGNRDEVAKILLREFEP